MWSDPQVLRRDEMRERSLAFAMITHGRLGGLSAEIPPDLVVTVMGFAGFMRSKTLMNENERGGEAGLR